MRGPPDTSYEAGINQYNTSLLSLSSPSHSLLTGAFVLSIEFLGNYPSIPPVVRFLTPVSTHTLKVLIHTHARTQYVHTHNSFAYYWNRW